MSGYILHILAYWINCFVLVAGMHEFGVALPGFESLVFCAFLGTIYTVLPDIDTPSSKARKTAEKITLIIIVLLLTGYLLTQNQYMIYLSIALAAILFFLWNTKHRGFFHTLPAALLFSLPLAFFDFWTSVFAFMGYFCHLIVDKAASAI